MTGLAKNHHAHAALSDDAGDNAERQALCFQHRPLLDMHLHICNDVAWVISRYRNIDDALP